MTELIDTSKLPSARHWARVGTDRRAGVAVPLFSLRSERSAGIGDVADLERFIDWCAKVDLSVIQLLPLNDLGPGSAPYGSISAFAVDPLFIALDRLPAVLEDDALLTRVHALSATLEAAPRVDFPRVRHEKMSLLWEVYERAAPSLATDGDFTAFCEANRDWLDDYALYRVLREVHGWRSWEDWGEQFASAEARKGFAKEHASALQFQRYHQYVIDDQLASAKSYAAARGVLLKGDIPILVGRDSADVWRDPRFYRLDTAAGAPPDYFSEDGQVWGFPTYDWEALWEDDCRWWRARLAHAERYFDLFRIDHVVGLFRIWTVRVDAKTGRDGWFVPGDESVWGEHGRRILQMVLDATGMLPLAEDLGVIPDVCRQTLAEMGVCGTKVLRWEKNWNGDGRFIAPEELPPLSMTTLSTHDTETLRGWWQNNEGERRQVWRERLGRDGDPPPLLTPELHEELIRQAARAGSIFVIQTLQDILAPFGLLPDDPQVNRVNVPGTVGDRNWTWRMPITIERLLDNDEQNARIRDMIRR